MRDGLADGQMFVGSPNIHERIINHPHADLNQRSRSTFEGPIPTG